MKQCEQCDKPLPEGSYRNKRYCNTICGNNARQEAKRRAAGVPMDRQQRTCPVCDKDFTTTRYSQQYCGKPCLWFALNQRRITKKRKTKRNLLPSPALIERRVKVIQSTWTGRQRLRR